MSTVSDTAELSKHQLDLKELVTPGALGSMSIRLSYCQIHHNTGHKETVKRCWSTPQKTLIRKCKVPVPGWLGPVTHSRGHAGMNDSCFQSYNLLFSSTIERKFQAERIKELKTGGSQMPELS